MANQRMNLLITQKHRVKIKAMPQGQGLGIIIPSRRELATFWKKCLYGMLLSILTLFIGGVAVLLGKEGGGSVGFVWLAFTMWFEIPALYDFFGQERILVIGEMLYIDKSLFGLKKRKRYVLRRITNIRHANATLVFDYRSNDTPQATTRSVTCCAGIDKGGVTAADANILVKHLSDILRFNCHQVEHILFGSFPTIHEDSPTCLQNPDVSELSFPFVYLQRVSIATKSYNFHLVERFLTYAVNMLGSHHLKAIDVHVYGKPDEIHQNLWNNFTYLCHHVYVNDMEQGVKNA